MSEKCTDCSESLHHFVSAYIASNKKKNGEYFNDLDLSICERTQFKYLKNELAKHGQLLKQNVREGHEFNFSIQGESGNFVHISLEFAETHLKQLREMS